MVSTCGNKHCASGEERHGGKGKVRASEDSFLSRHLPSYATLAAPQNGCDDSVGLCYHHHSLNVVAKGEWHRDVDDLNRVERYYLLVHNEIESVNVLVMLSWAVNAALAVEIVHTIGAWCLT